MSKPLLIGIMGSATVGKDTFLSLLPDVAGRKVTRCAFADELKKELDPLFRAFGGTAFETDPIKKAAIRKILVSHGMSQRIISNGTYWIKLLEPKVKEALARNEVVVITDCRFPNETEWIRGLGGKLIYIERKTENSIVPPVNEEEAFNDPLLRGAASHTISWPTVQSDLIVDKLRPFVYSAWTTVNTP